MASMAAMSFQEAGIISQPCYHPRAMSWRSSEAARVFHERTKHSPLSVRTVPHFLDWDNQPLAFKIYPGTEKAPLEPVAKSSEAAPATESLTVETLSRLLFYTAGVTKHLRSPRGRMPFRAAACTGALYHVELYLVTGGVSGLDAGVYHYDPRLHSLDRLRSGDFRAHLVEATGGEANAADAGSFLALTTTYWRNAWKYRARAYRHAFWDSGTMLANLFDMGAAGGIPMHLLLGFADEEVHRLLDVDAKKESAVALVAIADAGRERAASRPAPEPLGLETTPLSAAEVDYPEIREMQQASSLGSGAEARAWREADPIRSTRHQGTDTTLRHLDAPASEAMNLLELERVIRKRGSARAFQRDASVDYRDLSAILARSTRGVSADSLPAETTLCDPYVIVHRVNGLPPGAYAFHPRARGLELLREGDFRSNARFLDLEQDLAGDAAANLYLLVDLEPLLARYGDRGYRVAQLEGGLIGGRAYLASYALGLGASGLTFFDDSVTEFFSPHASGKSVMFLVAFGVPVTSRLRV
jgi:SagB-type dehydrogenase family enzyme